MITLGIVGPSPIDVCLIGIIPVIFIFILIFLGLKIKKQQKSYFPLISVIIISILLFAISIFFLFKRSEIIDKYWFVYDYSNKLLFLDSTFIIIIIVLSIFSISIISKIQKRNQKIISIVLLSLIVIIASYASLGYVDNVDVVKYDEEYEYHLSIVTPYNNSYTIYCPSIYEKDTNNLIILSENINGDCKIENFETEYGLVMKIEGSGSISIDYNYKGTKDLESGAISYLWNYSSNKTELGFIENQEKFGYYYYKEFDYLKYEFIIFYQSMTNQTAIFKLDYKFDGLLSVYEYHLEGELKNDGWQPIDGETRKIAIA